MEFKDKVTAVITTSPIPSHPSTYFIDQAYDSVRWHLPDIPVLILLDGVHQDYRIWEPSYSAYKQALRSKNWDNVRFQEFSTYTHQAGMARHAFQNGLIQTPLVLWVEHDFRLLPISIEWESVVQTLLFDREADSIRFSTDDGGVNPSYINHDDRGEFVSKSGLRLLKTVEYMTYPNIARRECYDAVWDMFDKGQTHLEGPARWFYAQDL